MAERTAAPGGPTGVPVRGQHEPAVPERMRAVAFAEYGAPEVLRPVDVPVPEPGPDEVLVRVGAAGVNPADCRIRSGQFRPFLRLDLPFVPGADLAGEVVATGTGVASPGPGDLVVGMTATDAGGGYGPYAVVPADAVVPVPAGVRLGDAAALPLAGLTALRALTTEAGVRDGDRVLVHGASGGVGTFAVQLAASMGATVTASCSSRNHELVRGIGAAATVDYRTTDVTALDERFDVVLDAADAHSYLRWRRILARGGTLVTVNPLWGRLVPDALTRLDGGRRWRSFLVRPDRDALAGLVELVAAGGVVPVVERSWPVTEAVAAHHHSESGRARGKLVLVVDAELADRTGS